MSRLIVVSNRVNPPTGKGDETVGGLAMALAAALREYSGLWFGWSGKTTPEFTGHLNLQRVEGVTVATVDLEEADLNEYYNGYANKTLWPLFHYRQDLTAYDRSFDEGYERVNRRFAETLRPLIEPDDLIWIHDYHLIPLARELRSLGVKNRIGFFLHIPWPAHQLITTLPRHKKLVEALFAYDLVGFQTPEYRQAFEEYVLSEARGVVTGDGQLRAFGRVVQAGAFPIGIDARRIATQAAAAVGKPAVRALRESLSGRHLAIGVDRLDYSKGLPERFRAFGRYLERHPAERGRLTLLQIAPVSRGDVAEYRQLRDQLEGIAGRINGTHAEPDWTPLRYVNRNFAHATLAGFYRAARVGLVTPLRDGMNLVAKEYVAAQDPDDPGALVLSMLAGAAVELEGALLVNPYDLDGVADAIATVATMPRERRIELWHVLMEPLRRNDIAAWRQRFLGVLEAA